MANVLDVKTRDYGRDIDADDPLMELSRIMGFDKPRVPSEPGRADPQIAIEDSFSMDLERGLELEEAPAEAPVQLDAEFNDAFEDELSEAMQFGEDAPSVVPSLEDELSALLGEGPLAAPSAPVAPQSFAPAAPVQDWSAPQRPEPDNSWLEEELLDLPATAAPAMEPEYAAVQEADPFEDNWLENELEAPLTSAAAAPAFDPAPAQATAAFEDNWLDAPQAQAAAPAVELAANAGEDEPWLDINLDEQLDMAGSEAELAYEPELENARALDPVLADMGRVSPAVYQEVEAESDESDLSAMDFDFALEESAPAVEPEYEPEPAPSAPPAPQFEAWQQPASSAGLQPGQAFAEDFERLLAETAPEPVVEAAEPMQETVAQTDDFEIPDFDFAPEPQYASEPTASAGGYETEYSGYEPKISQTPAPAASESDFDFEAMLDEQLAGDPSLAASGYGAAAGAAAAMRPQASQRVDADLDFQPFGDEAPAFPEAGYAEQQPRRKSWIVPAALAGVVLLGGGIYYAFSGNGASTVSGGAALVKADPQPVKIAPETPGGKAVPDQDKAVYNNVDGEQAALPTQGTLVSESEEPVDIASVAAEDTAADAVDPNAKSEARVDAAAAGDTPSAPSAETAAVSPKKVRTFIVKPDGTLVERPAEAAPAVAEAPAAATPAPVAADQPVAVPAAKPAAVAAAPEAEAPAAEPAAVADAPAAEVPAKAAAPAPEVIAKLADAEPAAAEAAPVAAEPEAAKPAPAIKVVKTKKIKAPAAETVASTTPADGAPVLESRPSDQPVNIVGKTGGKKAAAAAEEVQVAAADASPAPAAGGYAIQIASTPSPEAAKSTYAALNRKFLNVIGGRGVNIQKAEVDGKGTVYRVRIPAGSKQEAAALCAQYKASGGSCFVTK